MARIIQVLLPLVCVVLSEAQLHMPFFDHIPGLPHQARPISDGARDRPTQKNVGYNGGGYDTWFQHFGNPDTHSFNADSHERDKSYEDYDPFYHGDPYFQGSGWDQMPGINNVFNIPNPGYNNHRHQPPHKGNNPKEKPKQDHKDISNVQKPEEKVKEITPIDQTPIQQDKGSKLNEGKIPEAKNKLNEANISDVTNNSEVLPPKTNEIKKEDKKANKDHTQVGLEKKKDFLLVGQGDNGGNVYLLHENKPNPNTVVTPNGIQPGNNIIYVPYNPGQTNNPVYQVINGQPGSLPTNVQMTQDKLGAYNNAVLNPGQSTTSLNTGNQNPGYVTIYSNGQLIQIPGVVVNSAPNNAPLQNGNPMQGTNYIFANTVPNNVQTVPAVQNPGTNVIYATIPNQASNGPIYVQVPNCVNAMSNGCGAGTAQGGNNGMSNNGLSSNMAVYQANPNTVAQPAVLPNGIANGYIQPNMMANQPQGAMTVTIPNQGFSNQNSPYQPAVELPVNSGTNRYDQPIVSNLGQNVPNQGGMMGNQNVPIQTAVLMPVSNNNNGYNQPILSNQGQGPNVPNQGAIQMPVDSSNGQSNNGYNQPTATMQTQQVNTPDQGIMYNQYTPPQPAVQMPTNNGMNGYNQPMVSNQAPGTNAPNQGVAVSNQNTQLQPTVEIPIPNGYNVDPPVTNPNPVVNVGSRDDISSNQYVQPQPAATLNSGSNGYQQPQVSNQGDQGTNTNTNTPNNGEVINQEFDNAQPLATSSLVLDNNNLSSLGAQPAIMISEFKDKSGAKKDKKKSKDKKEKKDKGKKKDKKPKDDGEPKVSEPFTNQMKDVKR